ncbi:AraC family transcriptional regulator [Rheinheimera sp.]|uniref:helix-turn-helix domain-containing protein n=1 Tax=Rheinheimera sp. TaxID=1869214 RepID=UPI002732EA0C|nr:helix-turn-helix domain-containing protein [Rheinheimera sp.]MDP2716190.1 helix-turn-helix domain-containing protein [Rheinheimera sp.]
MPAIIADPAIAPVGNLQHLGLQAFMPHPVLAALVQCYWVIRQPTLPTGGYRQTLYPDGGSSLNFYFQPNQPPLCQFDGSQTLSSMQLAGTPDVIGIRFYPGGAFQLLGHDMPQLQGDAINAADLGISSLAQLQQQLGTTQLTATRLHHLEQWLLRQMQQSAAQSSHIQQVLPLLLQHQQLTTPSVSALSAAVNLSRRQFERKFLQQVGLTPGQLKLLQRVRHARQLINLNPQQALTDIALCSGFYDQAHFIHQFQRITGQTPGQYRRRKQNQAANVNTP